MKWVAIIFNNMVSFKTTKTNICCHQADDNTETYNVPKINYFENHEYFYLLDVGISNQL